ncbi:CcmD family protein [uncultured Hymenobacter sp.]|uniref:CcmD family protein n=1 Tax=uncultured Hymenobacter sp. TaxID=170016 RepID=UPI0035CC6E20
MKNNWLKAWRRLGAVLLLTLLSLPPLLAQTAQAAADTPEMADALRQSGKIYVVVLVILLILGGLLFYLVRLDRKVGRLEQELRDDK